jgi:hypothetical protein
MSTAVPPLPVGSVAVRMRVFGPADRELTDTVVPPWPRWMRRLYELHSLGSSHVDVVSGEVGVSAALAALQLRIAHRLENIGYVCAHLEELGWEIDLHGPDLVAHRVIPAQTAREVFAARHLESALLAVGDLDEKGLVRLYTAGELASVGGRGDE